MHQTTSGETPKVKIDGRKSVDNFLESSKLEFDRDDLGKNCIYKNLNQNEDRIINFLNTTPGKENSTEHQLKSLIRDEFDYCEKIYPYLGDAFLFSFFDKKILNSKSLKIFTKKTYKQFLETIPEKNSKNIVTWIIENSSPDREIDIQSSYVQDIEIVLKEDIFFDLEYDSDFLGNKKDLILKDYRFALIDGYIESIGEIHHLLHYAANSKEPHVIFCFGMSDEVKNVIIENNSRGITQIMPVSMSFSEETINILNDIAIVHNCDVISSLKGQTISQEMRKTLKVGKEIIFNRKGFSVKPIASSQDLKTHIRYLEKRVNEAEIDTNTDVIKKRIRNIKSKMMTIYVNKDLANSNLFNRSLDYGLRMLKNSHQPYFSIDLENKNILMPAQIYHFLQKRVNITKEIIYSIEKSVIFNTKE